MFMGISIGVVESDVSVRFMSKVDLIKLAKSSEKLFK